MLALQNVQFDLDTSTAFALFKVMQISLIVLTLYRAYPQAYRYFNVGLCQLFFKSCYSFNYLFFSLKCLGVIKKALRSELFRSEFSNKTLNFV